MKHIVDHPRTRPSSSRLERYADIDLKVSATPSTQTEALARQPRRRTEGKTLKQFATLYRRGD